MEKPTKNKPSTVKQKQQYNTYLRYSTLGLQMLGTLLICAWVGQWLDGYFNFQRPYSTIMLTLLGVVGSMFQLVKGIATKK